MQQLPTPTPQKSRTGLIIGLVVGGLFLFGVIIFFIVFLFAINSDRNWNLGLGSQQSSESVARLSDAVASETKGISLDTDVRNANTSGTPFGHTVDIRVLISHDRATEADYRAVLIGVAKAIASTKKDDSYRLFISPDIIPGVISGDGSKDQPLTSASDVSPGDGVSHIVIPKLQKEFKLSTLSDTDLQLKLRDAQRIAAQK